MNTPQPVSILIVDDTAVNIKYLGSLLTEQDYIVEFALNAKEALEWVQKKEFDLILLDVMMPEMDGYTLCTKLKEIEEVKDIPVIFITAKISKEDIIKGLSVGAVDYIAKPFNREELLLRVKAHITIQLQKKELQNLNLTKNKFFSIIAHDLINPFNALLSFSELLEVALNNNNLEESKIYQKYIQDASNNGYELLVNLLDWARLQLGRIDFKPEAFELDDTVNQAIDLVNQSAIQKNIKLIYQPNKDFKIIADKNMLSTILRNLLSNAVKFTNQDGKVEVLVNETTKEIIFEIKDNGVGIKQENVKKLFKSNTYLTTTGTNHEKGSGLGLTLCLDFVQNHRGNIWVESELNVGTSIFFTIPKLNKA